MYATEQQAAILRAAVEAIKQHPETFDMTEWAHRSDAPNFCGTVCCLAGQIVRNASTDEQWYAHVQERGITIPTVAESLLGNLDCDAAARLFYADEWPDRFVSPAVCSGECDPYNGCDCEAPNPTPEQLEARVEAWIETGE
jgi:hypothetical protein